MPTIFEERFTRDVGAIWADATGLGEDMLEPNPEADMVPKITSDKLASLGQEKPQVRLGPLFAIMGALLILGLLVAGGNRRPRRERFRDSNR